MKATSSVVLAALSAGAFGRVQPYNVTYISASPLPYEAHSSSSPSAAYESKPATPLPSVPLLESEPCQSETGTSSSMPTPESVVRTTKTFFVTDSTPTSEYLVVPQLAPSSIGAWSLSNTFYVVPVVPASNAAQSSPVVVPFTVSTATAQFNTGVITIPVPRSSLPAFVSTLLAQALSVEQSAAYTPGVVPSSTPGVIPSYTPGVVLPSYTPGIVPPSASSAPTIRSSFTTPSPLPTFVITSSGPVSATTAPTTPITVPSSAASAVSSAVSSIASQASDAASSIASAASSTLSSIASAASSALASPVSSSSAQISASSSRSSSARSTLSTSSTAAPNSSQGTSIPPAPSAGGSNGIGAKGKERVWWVAFLAPLVVFV